MLNKSEMSKIQAFLLEASDEQMNEIVQMFKDARSLKVARKARSFTVGQQVRWFSKRGAVSGSIIKINRKNIVVDAGQYGKWNVTASLLEAV